MKLLKTVKKIKTKSRGRNIISMSCKLCLGVLWSHSLKTVWLAQQVILWGKKNTFLSCWPIGRFHATIISQNNKAWPITSWENKHSPTSPSTVLNWTQRCTPRSHVCVCISWVWPCAADRGLFHWGSGEESGAWWQGRDVAYMNTSLLFSRASTTLTLTTDRSVSRLPFTLSLFSNSGFTKKNQWKHYHFYWICDYILYFAQNILVVIDNFTSLV